MNKFVCVCMCVYIALIRFTVYFMALCVLIPEFSIYMYPAQSDRCI